MGQSSGFSHAQYRITRSTPYGASAANLATGSTGTVVYTTNVPSDSNKVELLGVRLIATAALGSPTTRATVKVSVDPIDGGSNYFLQDEGLETPTDNTFQIPAGVAAGQVLDFPLAWYRGSRDFATTYHSVNAGDAIRVELGVVGSGGTQTFLIQFIYRLLPDAVDLGFYGQRRAGEGQFVGTGNPYPYGGALGQAEGYPNYEKVIPDQGSPYNDEY